MKKIIFGLSILAVIASAFFFGHSLVAGNLSYLTKSNISDVDLNDKEVEEAVTEKTYEVTTDEEAKIIDDDSQAEETQALASSESSTVESAKVKKGGGTIKDWMGTLDDTNKKLFRRVLKRRKKKKEGGATLPKLNKRRAEDLLKRAQNKQAKKAERTPKATQEQISNEII